MTDTRRFLERRNPIIKLALILILTLLISVSVFPLFSLSIGILTVLLLCCGSHYTLGQLVKKTKVFLLISVNFMFFMLLLKGIGTTNAPYRFLCFGWTQSDFWTILTLGMRILTISLLSVAFVATTDPNELVLSMILQLHLSPVHGYAALAAYRFLPTLQQEVESIRLAQKIRGIDAEKNLISRLTAPFSLMIPLLCSAVRKGERMAAAMELRGLTKGVQRTYYKPTRITKSDWLFFASTLVVTACIALLLQALGLFHFSFGFHLK